MCRILYRTYEKDAVHIANIKPYLRIQEQVFSHCTFLSTMSRIDGFVSIFFYFFYFFYISRQDNVIVIGAPSCTVIAFILELT